MRLIDADAIDECKELMTDIKGDTVYAVKMSDIREMPTVCDIDAIKDVQKWERVVSKAEVLEQIRAEIEDYRNLFIDHVSNNIDIGMVLGFQTALDTIDKYTKGERE